MTFACEQAKQRAIWRINAVKRWTRFNAKHRKLSNILIHVLRTIDCFFPVSAKKPIRKHGEKLNKLQWKIDKSEQKKK